MDPGSGTLRLLEGVSLGGAACDPHLAGWLVHFLQFYRPTLETVLRQRDRCLYRGRKRTPSAVASSAKAIQSQPCRLVEAMPAR